MRGLSFISLAVFLIGLASARPIFAKEPGFNYTDEWENTELSLPVLQEAVNSKNCMQSLNYFQACVSAINAVLEFANPGYELVSTKYNFESERLEKLIQSYGVLNFVEWKKQPAPKDVFAQVKLDRAERRAKNAALIESWNSLRVKSFPFTRTLTNALRLAFEKNEKAKVIYANALNSYLQLAFDPHTYIQPASYFEFQNKKEEQSFVGIGIFLLNQEGRAVIQNAIEGSSGMEAGLKPGDEIISVDGLSVEGKELSEIVSKIKGDGGTAVKLQLKRGLETLELQILRREVKVKNVESFATRAAGEMIGVIKVRQFIKNVCSKVKDSVEELKSKDVKALVLDLRGNLGGLLEEAVCMTGLFVGIDQVVVTQKDLQGVEVSQHQSKQEKIVDLPLVTLLNANSASASEVVSGALQDLKRSWILGLRSYGKGSVQGVFDIGGGVVKAQTTARFYLPSGRSNQIVGIIPDFEYYRNPIPTELDRYAEREEDEYENALPVQGSSYVSPRLSEIAKLSECMTNTGQADVDYRREKELLILPDYQMLKAADLLRCVQMEASAVASAKP